VPRRDGAIAASISRPHDRADAHTSGRYLAEDVPGAVEGRSEDEGKGTKETHDHSE
jgi:hypothetical protein